MKNLLKYFTLLSLALAPSSLAQNEWLDNVDIYLHTVERGTMVYDNFGHTAIRVHNKSTGDDLVYNWGIFDFRDPVDFSLKFYKGILVYRLGVYPYQNALAFYQSEKRTVWEDKINFSQQEKLTFLKRLDWNNLPENRNYNYHYFFDNCSTRVRDYFSEALKEQVETDLKTKMTGKDFRDAVREGYNTNPEIYFSLDTIMNKNIDREMSQWEEMFLPAKLRSHLLSYNNGKEFFSDSKILMKFDSPKPTLLNGFQIYALTYIFLIGGIFFCSIKKRTRLEKILWLFTTLLTFVLGVFGLTMMLNWIFSGHIDLHGNFNLLLLWPIDLILLWPLFLIIKKGKDFGFQGKKKRFWDYYINAHLMLNILFFLSSMIGLFPQEVWNLALYIAPVYSLLLFMVKSSYSQKESAMGYGIE